MERRLFREISGKNGGTGRSGLHRASQIPMLKPWHPVHQTVTSFGDGVFTEMPELKRGHQGGPIPVGLGSFLEWKGGHSHTTHAGITSSAGDRRRPGPPSPGDRPGAHSPSGRSEGASPAHTCRSSL